MTRLNSASDFYHIDEEDNDALCGEIDTPNIDTVFAWMEAFAAKRVQQELEAQSAHIHALEEANQILTRASSLSAQDLARVHIRNEARFTARIKQLEEANGRLRRVLDISPFCLTLQDDDYCLWCQREKPDSDDWKTWEELQGAEFHDAGCEFVAVLSPAPATTDK